VPTLLLFYGDIALNGGVLGFAALVTLATGIVFGVAPAWQASLTERAKQAAQTELNPERLQRQFLGSLQNVKGRPNKQLSRSISTT